MKFTQICTAQWKQKSFGYFTVFALGEDGRVYKSVSRAGKPNHTGWIPLRDTVLAEDYAEPLSPAPKAKAEGA